MKKQEVIEIDYNQTDLLDASHPDSLMTLLPPYMVNHIEVIPKEFLAMGDEELRKMGKCDVTEGRLKQAFWMEYNNSLVSKRKMNMNNVYSGICSSYQFRDICKSSYKLAYLLRPPTNYKAALHEMLVQGIDQARDILLSPHYDDDGKFNAAHANIKLKIIETVFNRTLGGVVQKNMNVNVDATPKEDEAKDTLAKIKEYEEKILQHQGRLVDVQAREVGEAEEGS